MRNFSLSFFFVYSFIFLLFFSFFLSLLLLLGVSGPLISIHTKLEHDRHRNDGQNGYATHSVLSQYPSEIPKVLLINVTSTMTESFDVKRP